MNQYHIYEALGRGKHSVVYKGRKKKTISYYAIKSVEKSQKARVLQEVRTMHALNSANILKFYAWYETTNHLWLILEYCVGGDLMSLLRQDMRLPETSMHDFGRDLVTAMHFLHSHSIIYCDLKPSNILLDENGRIKLGGFGLSRRLSDINKTPVTGLPPAKRGTPCYMAPELFQEDATHSSASDLWSLGCVLYECAAGHPPFVSTSFNQLVHDILNKDPAPLPSASKEFNDMVAGLLDKNPATRMTWKELIAHPFWNFRLPERPMPAEPALEAFIERNSLRPKPAAGVRESQTLMSEMLRSVNVNRMSAVARNNLDKESDGQEYTAATAGPTRGDVRLENADAELDFEERQADAESGAEEEEGSHASGEQDDSGAVGSQNNNHRVGLNKGVEEGVMRAQPRGGHGGSPVREDVQHPTNISATEEDDMATTERPAVEDLIWHASDSAVKPIVGNRRIERVAEPRWEARSLSFPAMSLQEMLAACQNNQTELETFLTHIYRAVAGAAPLKDKVNVLAYFETLCTDTTAANVLINSSLTILFVRMLRNARAPTLRVRLASVIGLLVRHATFIADELAATGVLEVLAETLRDKNERVRRRAMATLGELLFYIATQQQDAAALGKGADVWQVSPNTVAAVLRLLRMGEDETAQHYAVKTVENIASQNISGPGNDWGSRLGTPDTMAALVQLFNSTRNEGLKATIASTMSRLLRFNPSLVSYTMDKFGVRLILSGLSDSSAKVQTAAINMLNLGLSSPDISGRTRSSLGEERSLVPAVVALLDNSLASLRAKGVVSLVLLSRLSSRYLLDACNAKAVPIIEKLARDKEPYVRNAVGTLRDETAGVLEAITQQVSSELDGLSRGRRLTPTSGMRPRTGGSHLSQFPVVLHLLTSPAFRSAAVTPALVTELATYLSVTCQPSVNFTGMAEFKTTLLHTLEALSQNMETLLQHYDTVLGKLLPALATAVASNHETGDTRFLCLKLTCDILLLYLTEPDIYAGDRDGTSDTSTSGRQIDNLVQKHVLPLLPGLLEDEDPMPLYALKLLGALLEARSAWVDAIDRLGLIPKFFEFLSLDHTNNNVHNIRLCRLVIAAGNVRPSAMASLGVVPKVAAVVEYAHENRVEPFLEPVLELCQSLLEVDGAAVKAGEAGAGVSGPLVGCYDIFLELATHPDPPLAVAAAQCEAALLATHPGDAARALLSTEGAGLTTAVLVGPRDNMLPRHRTQQVMLEALMKAIATGATPRLAGPEYDALLAAVHTVGEQGDRSLRFVAQEAAAAVSAAMR